MTEDEALQFCNARRATIEKWPAKDPRLVADYGPLRVGVSYWLETGKKSSQTPSGRIGVRRRIFQVAGSLVEAVKLCRAAEGNG